ncbi:hypothetical protein SLE2022_185720 [Rubroshorea leprosula]
MTKRTKGGKRAHERLRCSKEEIDHGRRSQRQLAHVIVVRGRTKSKYIMGRDQGNTVRIGRVILSTSKQIFDVEMMVCLGHERKTLQSQTERSPKEIWFNLIRQVICP